MNKIVLSCLILLLGSFQSGLAQEAKTSNLYLTLKQKDSLLFNVGFNKCIIGQFEDLVSDNFEFYHDQGGITKTKPAFINSIKTGICNLSYKPERQLEANTLEVYPLFENGVLYGAIQSGVHRFYAIEQNCAKRLSTIARFTHVWILEAGAWKLSRGLSYDHKAMN